MIIRTMNWLGQGALWLAVAIAEIWAMGALAYDFPWASLRNLASALFGIVMLGIVAFVPGKRRKLFALTAGFALILGWWFTLTPSNERDWQPDVARTAWAEIDGDSVTLHNVRNCEYRTEMDYTPRWETRRVRLSQITGIDLAINYWGSPYMAHPIASFQFADARPVCFSIETRKETGEGYSVIGGLYRQYELIYVCAEERDVIRVRTNFRNGEDVYLYHLNIKPEAARKRFMEYLNAMNALREKPRWYNAVTTNCTTSIRTQVDAAGRAPWDWRILVNGFGDEMMYERGSLDRSTPFPELKRRSLINSVAKAAGDSPDFSARIRAFFRG